MAFQMIDITRFLLDKRVLKNKLLAIQMWGLRIFGYMIFTHQYVIKLHCFRGTLFTVSFVVFNLSQYIDLYFKLDNVNEVMTNAATTLLFTTCVFRMFNFYWNRTRYVNLVKAVDDGVQSIIDSKNEVTNKILDDSSKYVKYLTILFWSCAMLTANLMCVNSYLQSFYYQPSIAFKNGVNISSFPPVILRSWFPFDDQWQNFSYVYWIQFYIMWLGMIIVPCQHVFIVGIMIYLITELKILIHKLENLSEQQGKFYNQEIAECSQHQGKIRSLTKELESLMSGALFLDFVIFSVLLCALLFQISQSEFGVDSVIHFFYILTMVGILWMYYWHANEILYYSSMLPQAAYSCHWYNFSNRFNKQLLFYILGAKPIKMYAGLVILSLDNFLAILRASYSYFTLLTQIAH